MTPPLKGQTHPAPNVHRLVRTECQNVAYHRLAAAILGVDVVTLTHELRERRLEPRYSPKAA
jgi:hypothetical protein